MHTAAHSTPSGEDRQIYISLHSRGGLFFPGSVYFANESVSPADRVQGQSIRTILAISLSTLLGSLVSGYLIDLGGTTLMLWFSTGCASIGVLIALGALAVQKKSVRV